MNEEPFGPMAIINPFKSFDDAVTEANRLPFGLAAYAWTKSAKTAKAIAAQVETGMMSINHVGLGIRRCRSAASRIGYGPKAARRRSSRTSIRSS